MIDWEKYKDSPLFTEGNRKLIEFSKLNKKKKKLSSLKKRIKSKKKRKKWYERNKK